jgi:hypothetical protein
MKEQGGEVVGMVVCNNQTVGSKVGAGRVFKCIKRGITFWSKHMFPEESLTNGRRGIIGVEGEVNIASLFIVPRIRKQSVFDAIQGS